jgi:hypothetical protein
MYDYENSKALYVLKIVTMSFAILACVVVVTAMLTRWIIDLNQKIKESGTKMAKAAARLDKFRKSRIKHILKQRKLQLIEEREEKKNGKKKNRDKVRESADTENECESESFGGISVDEGDMSDFDNELSDIIIDLNDEEE